MISPVTLTATLQPVQADQVTADGSGNHRSKSGSGRTRRPPPARAASRSRADTAPAIGDAASGSSTMGANVPSKSNATRASAAWVWNGSAAGGPIHDGSLSGSWWRRNRGGHRARTAGRLHRGGGHPTRSRLDRGARRPASTGLDRGARSSRSRRPGDGGGGRGAHPLRVWVRSGPIMTTTPVVGGCSLAAGSPPPAAGRPTRPGQFVWRSTGRWRRGRWRRAPTGR